MKLEKIALANAFALSTAILWTLCSAIVTIFPSLTWEITKWWMHGMDISVMGSWNMNLANFIFGGLTLTASAWITGWIFGWSWEIVSKSSRKR